MRHSLWLLLLCVLSLPTALLRAEDPVFSGPQIDEKLPAFKAIRVVGEEKGQEFDIVSEAGDKPLVLVFFHKLTRPAFGMTRSLLEYTQAREKKGLHTAVIFLSDDPNETQKMGAIQYFPQDAHVGVSTDGIEGPGSYGLNRNMELTILVGEKGKVTANFALVQPSLPSDGPKILKAIADLLGEDPPKIDDLTPAMQGAARTRMDRANQTENKANPPSRDGSTPDAPRQSRGDQDARLDGMLRQLISNKTATADEVASAVAEIESYVAKNENARRDLVNRSSRIVSAGVVARYGNEQVQAAIRKWAQLAKGNQP